VGSNVTAASENVEDHHLIVVDAVNDDLLSDGKTAETGPQVIAPASHVRMLGQQPQSIHDRVNEAVGNRHRPCLPSHVQPYVVEFCFGSRQ
jgi:hypothetical protein